LEKQAKNKKRGPKLKDKKQSERFKEAVRQLGAQEGSDAFEAIIKERGNAKAAGKGSKE
jgi:hypothetical protein